MTISNSDQVIKIASEIYGQSKQAGFRDLAGTVGSDLIGAGGAIGSAAQPIGHALIEYGPTAAAVGGGLYATNSFRKFVKDHIRKTRQAHLMDSMKTIGEHASGKRNQTVNIEEIRRRHPELAAAMVAQTKTASYGDQDGGSGIFTPAVAGVAAGAIGAGVGGYLGSQLHQKAMNKATPALRQQSVEQGIRQLRAERLESGRKNLGAKMVQESRKNKNVANNPFPTLGGKFSDATSDFHLAPRGVRKFFGRTSSGVGELVGAVFHPGGAMPKPVLGKNNQPMKDPQGNPIMTGGSPKLLERAQAREQARRLSGGNPLRQPLGSKVRDYLTGARYRTAAGFSRIGRAFSFGGPKAPEEIAAGNVVKNTLAFDKERVAKDIIKPSQVGPVTKAMNSKPSTFANTAMGRAANRRAMTQGRAIGGLGFGLAGMLAANALSGNRRRQQAPPQVIVNTPGAGPNPLYR